MSDGITDAERSNRLDEAERLLENGQREEAIAIFESAQNWFHYGRYARQRLKELKED